MPPSDPMSDHAALSRDLGRLAELLVVDTGALVFGSAARTDRALIVMSGSLSVHSSTREPVGALNRAVGCNGGLGPEAILLIPAAALTLGIADTPLVALFLAQAALEELWLRSGLFRGLVLRACARHLSCRAGGSDPQAPDPAPLATWSAVAQYYPGVVPPRH